MRRGTILLLALWAPLARAQDGDETDLDGLEIGEGAGEDVPYQIEVDPFQTPPSAGADPNRPPPLRVGQWEPPALKERQQTELAELSRARGERPDDAGVRYRLAAFYREHGWYPHAEAELLRAAELDPESIRPWVALIEVYTTSMPQPEPEEPRFGPGIRLVRTNRRRPPDWLPSPEERDRRITRAYEELLRRRPDDVAQRRAFFAHLKSVDDHAAMLREAREILRRMPGDARTRFDLAEALRREADARDDREAGTGDDARAEARRLLEQNVRDHPGHAASLLRLARMIAVAEGTKADDRIRALETRAFFRLFVRPELPAIEFREDTFRMARNLAGPRIARDLWDDLFLPPRLRDNPWGRGDLTYRRWLTLKFPHALPRDRERVVETLARRGDEAAAVVLVSFLWHLEDPEVYDANTPHERRVAERIETAALDAAGALGTAAYPAAAKWLAAAQTPLHRRRAIALLTRLDDPRSVQALVEALQWDTHERTSLGVAAALERFGDARAIGALVDAALDVRRPTPRRREAVEALAAFQDPRALEALNRVAKEDGFRLVAAYGIFRLNDHAPSLAVLAAELAEAGGDPFEAARLLAKCDDPRVADALRDGYRAQTNGEARIAMYEVLRAKWWGRVKDAMHERFLEEAKSTLAPPHVLRELGAAGGATAVERLEALLEQSQATRWLEIAEAFAQTGDARAVRYFARMKILEKDEHRRTAAERLHGVARKRQAERARAAAQGE